MADVYLSLGSNIEPQRHLAMAVRELHDLYRVVGQSSVYQSPAVGFDGDDFLNLVMQVETAAAPAAINEAIERLHELAGRERGSYRFAPRPLDVDLLLYDDLVVAEPGLTLPRADVLDYAFVLGPLAEIAPDLVHPVTGVDIATHWRDFDATDQPLTRIGVEL